MIGTRHMLRSLQGLHICTTHAVGKDLGRLFAHTPVRLPPLLTRRRSLPREIHLAAGHALAPDRAMLDDGSDTWKAITDSYERARARGAAYKTDTDVQLLRVPSYNIQFVLRVATALRDKPKPPKDSGQKKEWVNPFLPYEEDLWVCHLSPTHTLLLNKFNVVAHHLICVTRVFEPQATPLNAADLDATWRAMGAFPAGALAYFNCGPDSGASQPHKHTQIVPLPLAEGCSTEVPLQRVVEAAARQQGAGAPVPLWSLPFQSYAALLPSRPGPEELEGIFSSLLACFSQGQGGDSVGGLSYNMVLTDAFMMLVPRSKECYGPVAVNSMGYAGSMLVRSQEELDFIRAEGPMRILAAVGVAWAD